LLVFVLFLFVSFELLILEADNESTLLLNILVISFLVLYDVSGDSNVVNLFKLFELELDF